jgi:hypothetical protein
VDRGTALPASREAGGEVTADVVAALMVMVRSSPPLAQALEALFIALAAGFAGSAALDVFTAVFGREGR